LISMPIGYILLPVAWISLLDEARWISAVGVLAHLGLASAFLGTILMAVVAEFLYITRHDETWRDKARMFSVVSTIFFGVASGSRSKRSTAS